MAVVLVVIAILFGLLVLLLAVPVDVAFRFEGIEAFKGQLAIRWLFGLVRLRIHLPGTAQPRPPQPEAKTEAAKVRVKPKERGGRPPILAVLRQAAFRRRAYRLVKDLVRATRPQQLRLRMRLGLGDPADTGRLWAFVGPLNALAQNLRNAEVRIEPEFMHPVCEFEVHGRFLLVPLQYLAVLIVFALSPPSIQAWHTLRRSHA